VSRVGDLDEGHVGSSREHLPLVGRDADVVVFALYEPGPGSRVAESLGERAMSVEVGEVQTGLSAQKARVVVLELVRQEFTPSGRQAALHGGTDESSGGAVPPNPGIVVAMKRIGASRILGSARRSS